MSDPAPHPAGLQAPARVSKTRAAVSIRDGRKPDLTASLNAATAVLFSLTVFMSAALLFMLQPMFAKMALPLLGGTPAVWNTCMVFFQAVLLVGYSYAHAAPAVLGLRRQAALHLVLLLAALCVLPVAIPENWNPTAHQNPFLWLLTLLLVALGLPFLVVSTTAPLAQTWFTGTDHPSARDPYFLYAASNAGSLAALLAYPTLVEPNLRLADQSRLWALGYVLLITLLLGCAALVWHSRATSDAAVPAPARPAAGAAVAPAPIARNPASRRVRWILLAFVPSSLMLGVTTYLTTDVAPMPLFWLVPLAVYLLTFVLAFGRRPRVLGHRVHRLIPILILPLTMTIAFGAVGPLWVLALLHLLTFLVISLLCHGELATTRPSADRLTEFFLWVAVGGVLGGVFNALLAPVMFSRPIEYPLMLVAACLLRRPPATGGTNAPARWEYAVPFAVGAVTLGLASLVKAIPIAALPGPLLVAAVPALLCFALRYRPLAFGLGLGALILATTFLREEAGYHTLHRERSFFGIWQVRVYPTAKFTALLNGTTEHGRQSLEPGREREPLSYFHRAGPLGQVFEAIPASRGAAPVAVIGLGTGSLACHGRPGQEFTFYEIDPVVLRIARNLRYFTFLENCPPAIRVVLGDARRSLVTAPDGHYGLIILDAFSSDAIPSHLLTREALRLYLDKLARPGLLAFHISNRHLDLEPIVGNLAHDASLFALGQLETGMDREQGGPSGRTPSHWVVLARREEDLGALRDDRRWHALPPRPDRRLWTDDFSNILEVIRWR
jgi:hypothetical protein